ncbi:hypothetical protein DFH27DRAFT_656896 [Peziza echinospora]|nr:hypothetical protein DFH27DRAFT_656896 [Peziza echinospora]
MPDHTSSTNPHPHLQQLPLSVSPFTTLPTALTLPYTYRPLPATLPPPTPLVLLPPPSTSTSSTSALPTPTTLTSATHALLTHLQALRAESEEKLAVWERGIRERELAEMRRVAPGWLDTGIVMLVPERVGGGGEGGKGKEGEGEGEAGEGGGGKGGEEGRELDRMFGGLGV